MSLMSELGSTKRIDDFIRVTTLEELKTAGMVVVRGTRCPLLVVSGTGAVVSSRET